MGDPYAVIPDSGVFCRRKMIVRTRRAPATMGPSPCGGPSDVLRSTSALYGGGDSFLARFCLRSGYLGAYAGLSGGGGGTGPITFEPIEFMQSDR